MRFSHEFKPTAAMELYAFQRAKLGEKASIKATAERSGVTRETASRWQNIKGFDDWLVERVTYYRAPVLEMLEQVGLARLNEYKYWEAMAYKYGFLVKEQQPGAHPAQPIAALTKDDMIELIKAARAGK